MSRSPIAAGLLLISLACASPSAEAPAPAPASQTQPKAEPVIATFRCGDGTAMQVDFDDERVEIELADGRNFRLARAPSGSGAKYSDGQNLFWEHRGEAYIVLEGEAFDQCVAD